MNNSCSKCINDCDQFSENERCENFKEAKSIAEYNRIIKEQNKNLHKLCNKYELKYSELTKMLRYKSRMKFKYRVAIEEFLYGSENEWKKWEENGSRVYG